MSRDTPRAVGYRMPAEWEPHTATWLSWPHNIETWPGKFEPVPQVFAQIVAALHQHEAVHILAGSARRSLHGLFLQHGKEKIFRGGDVLGYFRHGPPVGSGFKIPLRRGEAFGRVYNTLAGFFQILNRFVAIGLGLREGTHGSCRKHYNEGENSLHGENLLQNCEWLKWNPMTIYERSVSPQG